MPAWYASSVIADSVTFNAGQMQSVNVEQYHSPAVCVSLESLEGNAEETITVAITGDAGTYDVDERTLSATGSYVVPVPQCESVEVTSGNGTQLSAEVRNNPR